MSSTPGTPNMFNELWIAVGLQALFQERHARYKPHQTPDTPEEFLDRVIYVAEYEMLIKLKKGKGDK
jgi:hypothetical protein